MLLGHISGSRTGNPRCGSRSVLRAARDDGDLFGLLPVTDRGMQETPGKTASRAPSSSAGLESERPPSLVANGTLRRRQIHV